MSNEPKEGTPGPGDYYTIDLTQGSRPLTAKKSHSIAKQHFGKAIKNTMKVSIYDRAYERSYKNEIGPGPAAYSEVYRHRMTDNFKKTAFPKNPRRLTQPSTKNPGPDHY